MEPLRPALVLDIPPVLTDLAVRDLVRAQLYLGLLGLGLCLLRLFDLDLLWDFHSLVLDVRLDVDDMFCERAACRRRGEILG